MSDEEIALEYEMMLADSGKQLKTCHQCGFKTHRDECPACDMKLSGDKVIDDAFARIEAGEEVDLERALRGDKWEPVELKGSE